MVYGVSRIALPTADWSDSARTRGRLFQGAEGPETGDFVAGPENRLVVPALERLLASKDEQLAKCASLFNPLVLVGPTGFGKSHLARGITRHWTDSICESAAEYLTAADFARQLRSAREGGELQPLRDRLTGLQLFVLEDLHNLPPSTFVQRELRDTLDGLLDGGAAIFVTTKKPTATIEGLDPGLRDRLAQGLTLRLQAPGFEARQEVLRTAAAKRGLTLSEEQLQQLAQSVEGTVPQLHRALSELELAENCTQPADHEALANMHPTLKFKQILAVVARYFSLTQAALCSPARRKSLVYARGVAVHLARTLTNLSYSQIGQHLGRRDHTTIMHASQSILSRLTTDATTQQDVEELKRILMAV